jgi:hypothetical protein
MSIFPNIAVGFKGLNSGGFEELCVMGYNAM